ncbi:MAG TPA: arginine--tRNA ligase, partial [Acidimicrobiales bacterium]
RGATLLLYVVGAPQAQHLEMCFEVARLAGWLVPPARAVHVPFGNVLGPDRKMFKTRSGATVKLVDLLDEAVERAAAAVAEKNPDLADQERAAVARAVGIGAVKYADLSTDRVKDYVFDWDRMLAFEGNTAPYLQYAHARIRSILRRGEVNEAALVGTAPSIAEPSERALALTLLAFDAAVQETVDRYAPHRLCVYLFELASAFTTFYEACPVLKAPDESTRQGRLVLCALTARVLAQGLGLLGIHAPDRM